MRGCWEGGGGGVGEAPFGKGSREKKTRGGYYRKRGKKKKEGKKV